MSGQMARQAASRSSTLASLAGRFIRLQDARGGVLERNVEIGKDQSLGHQRDDLVDVRIGIDIVEPHPGTQLAELAGQIGHVGAHLAAALEREGLVPEVEP